MKITVTTGIYPPDIGGPATYSKFLSDELPKRGIDVSILSFGEVRKFPKIVRHIIFIIKLLKKAKNADIIFTQDTVSVGFPSLIVSKILHKKFFVRVPGDYAWEQATQRFNVIDSIDDFQNKKYGLRSEFLRKIQKMTVNNANIVITPSLYFKDLVSKWVRNKDKVFCIYNGINLSLIPKSDNLYNSKTIISAGRLVPWKGFSVLIDLMNNLKEWKLFIVGDGPLRKELELRVKDNNVMDRVFLLGNIPRNDLISKMQECDVFVLNTHFESFSFQVVEALAAGIPVVTTNIGNLKEIIDDGKNGILVKPDDIKAIFTACIRLSSDKSFRKSIIDSGYEKSRQFSIERTLDNLISLIKLS